MELNDFLATWIPIFGIMGISVTGIILYARVRASYKIQEMRTTKSENKKKESFSGAIQSMIDDAPANLRQIESEIATIQEKARKEKIPPEKVKELLSRLEQERDLLKYAVKYGNIAKPLAGTVGKLAEKMLNGIGGT